MRVHQGLHGVTKGEGIHSPLNQKSDTQKLDMRVHLNSLQCFIFKRETSHINDYSLNCRIILERTVYEDANFLL